MLLKENNLLLHICDSMNKKNNANVQPKYKKILNFMISVTNNILKYITFVISRSEAQF